jgi:uncharacterized protein (TIGR03067 family)
LCEEIPLRSLQQLGLVLILVPFSGLAVFSDEPAPAPQPANAKELEQLRGDWALVKRTLPNGTVCRYRVVKPIGSDENLTFDGWKVVTEYTYCDPTDTLEESLRLDPTRTPKWIDLTVLDASFPVGKLKGRTRLGVYEVDGDRLRLSVGGYDTKRPAGFEPHKGYEVSEYKRIR